MSKKARARPKKRAFRVNAAAVFLGEIIEAFDEEDCKTRAIKKLGLDKLCARADISVIVYDLKKWKEELIAAEKSGISFWNLYKQKHPGAGLGDLIE